MRDVKARALLSAGVMVALVAVACDRPPPTPTTVATQATTSSSTATPTATPTPAPPPPATPTPHPAPDPPLPLLQGVARPSGTFLVRRGNELWSVSLDQPSNTQLQAAVPTGARYLGYQIDAAGINHAFAVSPPAPGGPTSLFVRSQQAPSAPATSAPGAGIRMPNGGFAYAGTDGIHVLEGPMLSDRLALPNTPCSVPVRCTRYVPIGVSADGVFVLVKVQAYEGGFARILNLKTNMIGAKGMIDSGLGWEPAGSRVCGTFSSYGGPMTIIAVGDLATETTQSLAWPSGRAPDDLYGKEVLQCAWSPNGEIAVLTGPPSRPASGRPGHSVVFFDTKFAFTAAYELSEARLIGWAPDASGVMLSRNDSYVVLDRQGVLRSLDVGGTIVDIVRP